MGNATLPGTQVEAMHALSDLMFDTTVNPGALPTYCWGLLARAGHSLGLGTFRYSKHDFLPGCSLGPQKMPHPGQTSWGIGHTLLPSPCPPSPPGRTPSSEISSREQGLSLSIPSGPSLPLGACSCP